MNNKTDQIELADNTELHENVEELATVDDCIIQRVIVDEEAGWIRQANSKESDFMVVTDKR